jgi:segregation and condensation protein A
MQDYRVELEVFRGPMDLLLFLVRANEIDICDIPIARVTEQYLEYLDLLSMIDVELAGDFLVMASTLMEIKSRMLLPRLADEDPNAEDPRSELVRQLLEYKQFKDAASVLEERGRDWQQRFARLADDHAATPVDPANQPIHEVELWDLVGAYSRLMRETLASASNTIVYDDTPIHVYMARIEARLAVAERVRFSELLASGNSRAQIIGSFLALLELIRRQRVRAIQEHSFGDIWIVTADSSTDVTAEVAADESSNLAERPVGI